MAVKYMGKPCRHGHIGERYVNSGKCCACAVARSQKRRRVKGVKPRARSVVSNYGFEFDKYRRHNARRQAEQGGYLPVDLTTVRLYPADGRCEFCGYDQRAKSKISLHMDHDHTTGKFRAWLCWSCNKNVGWIEWIEKKLGRGAVNSFVVDGALPHKGIDEGDEQWQYAVSLSAA